MTAFTIHITLYDVAFFATACVGIGVFTLLCLKNTVKQQANRILAFALGLALLSLLQALAADTLQAFNAMGELPTVYLFATGPLLYFYVLRITAAGYKFKKAGLLHFIPSFLMLAACIISIVSGRSLGILLPGIYPVTFLVLHSLPLVSVTAYSCLCLLAVHRYNREQTFTAGDRYRLQLRWLHNLLITSCIGWLLCFILAGYQFYFSHNLGYDAFYPFYLLHTCMWIWMAGRTLAKGEEPSPASAALIKQPLPADLKHKATWLKNTIKQNNYYQDPELTLSSLAQKLHLSTHELSRLINTVLKKNFNDFINEYRVQAAVRKMNDPGRQHITLLGIAYESGFNSQSSFSRVFKQMTGKSPAEFKKEYKKEFPSYNLGSEPKQNKAILNRESAFSWRRGKIAHSFMFKNYFKIAWRNLKHNKSYAAINITGLAAGIAVCMMIFIVIQFQTSFENFNPKKERIYRVLTEYNHAGSGTTTYGKDLPFPIPAGLKTAFPQIEAIAPVYASQNDQVLTLDNNGNTDKLFKEQRGLFYAGPSFFKIFNFPLLAGSYESLNDPSSVILTKETAEKYFGDWRLAMGKTIKLEAGGFIFSHGTERLKISGILNTIPANTDLQLKVVVSYENFFADYIAHSTDWNTTVTDFGCYVLLPPNVSAENFNRQLRSYSRSVKSASNLDDHALQPLAAIHHDTQTGNYSNTSISHDLLNVLWLIAGFILLIACVNFINLSTAQAVNRAKEVGVRKVLGSSKTQLQAQFIVETFLIVAGAVLLAIVFAVLSLPYVSRLLDLSLSVNILGNPVLLLFLLVITIVVTVLAGFYPSIVLSRFNPVNALKSKIAANAASGISLRRGLVVFQFMIAQVLIIGTLTIVKQMNFFMNQPLGFDKDAIVTVPFRVDSLRISRLDYLKNQLLAVNGVQAVNYTSNTPVENGNDIWSTLKFNHSASEADFKAITKFADESYVPAYKLQLMAGRNLKPSPFTKEFLVNESLVKSLGLKNPEDILNKEISIWNDQIKCPVVGVLKDFNDRSLQHGLAPLLVATNVTMYNQAGIKLSTENIPATMQAVKKVFESTFPDFVYEYKFLDDKIAGFYKQEEQLAQLYQLFSVIAIFLSCLGLYGLASFMAVQRVKEVGIRKVLGASAGSIVYLFSKEFMILIGIAFVIAAPIAWFAMQQWLQDYVYRISVSWWLFAAGGAMAIIIALATLSFQAVKAAMANPVKSLRSE